MGRLGRPRVHLRRTDSTNTRARELAGAGAPSGTLVTAREQTAGRGRQGRSWSAPPGRALIASLVIRPPDPLLPLRAGLAVADLAARLSSEPVTIKWPNDVLLAGRKLAGILVEGRPGEGWAVLGIGVNVAVRVDDLPPGLRDRAATLGAEPDAIEPALATLLAALETRLGESSETTLAALRERDALRDQRVRWSAGEGTGAGIDDNGGLRVRLADGTITVLEAGEAHLGG